ncbi:hypothetical protein [Absidia glauca]|uniref:Major facilitator superfamily (MFS) profile domain-containing protein n=1 Tax=Absidia glauca TaxID=4829 RepID=A0A163JM27_ABSGL|nr:hypothetical protein [Absidia glauca]
MSAIHQDEGLAITKEHHDPENPKVPNKESSAFETALIRFRSFIRTGNYGKTALVIPGAQIVGDFFETPLKIVNLSIGFYSLLIGVGPIFLAPLSERYGRRWIYIGSVFLFTLFGFLSGISTSFASFLTFRLLQGAFAGVGAAVGGGSCADLFHDHEQGRAVGLYMFATITGPAMGPFVGGYVAKHFGWQWMEYVLAVFGGAVTLISFFFMKETLYLAPSPPLSDTTKEVPSNRSKVNFNLMGLLHLFCRPEIGLVCLGGATAYGWYCQLITMLSPIFTSLYGFSADVNGALYATGGVGSGCGAIMASLISDRFYRWQIKRNGGITVIEYRLTIIWLAIPFIVVGSLIYGWCLQLRRSFYVPIIGYFLFSLGMTLIITAGNTYLVEAFPRRAASGNNHHKLYEEKHRVCFPEQLLTKRIRPTLCLGSHIYQQRFELRVNICEDTDQNGGHLTITQTI